MNKILIITPLISAAQIQYNTIQYNTIQYTGHCFNLNGCSVGSTRIWGKIDVSKYIYLSFLRSESQIDAFSRWLAARIASVSLISVASF